MPKKQTYTSSKKIDVVRDLLRGDKTMEQVCIKHAISKGTASGWKKQFDENAHLIFELQRASKIKGEEYFRENPEVKDIDEKTWRDWKVSLPFLKYVAPNVLTSYVV